MGANANSSYYDLTSFLSPRYDECGGTLYLGGSPQANSDFEITARHPSTSQKVSSLQINATIIFGDFWTANTNVALSAAGFSADVIVLKKNDIISAASVDLGCGITNGNSLYEDYMFNISVTWYYLDSSPPSIGHSDTEFEFRFDAYSTDDAWIAVRDVVLTYVTSPPAITTCPTGTYAFKAGLFSLTPDLCVCKFSNCSTITNADFE